MPEGYSSVDLAVGDGVLLPLFNGSKVIFIDREPYLAVRRRGIAARIDALGQPSEKITALNGYILTRRDREAFEKHMHGGLPFPDEFLDSGMPCDAHRADGAGADRQHGHCVPLTPAAAPETARRRPGVAEPDRRMPVPPVRAGLPADAVRARLADPGAITCSAADPSPGPG